MTMMMTMTIVTNVHFDVRLKIIPSTHIHTSTQNTNIVPLLRYEVKVSSEA